MQVLQANSEFRSLLLSPAYMPDGWYLGKVIRKPRVIKKADGWEHQELVLRPTDAEYRGEIVVGRIAHRDCFPNSIDRAQRLQGKVRDALDLSQQDSLEQYVGGILAIHIVNFPGDDSDNNRVIWDYAPAAILGHDEESLTA